MKTTHTSIFNLIEIFRKAKATVERNISPTHCSTNYHHDFYCDAEKPFINK
ncbi:hypothetical protein Q2T40_17475 [Winogradskyella maritima]|uniref:Uncharacterized protein n=1 Tax=Winogradskyella maritima TaxID=1517766 RepID=A0ABV8AED3_9FLAO|nr:hypothetical protein [Winogradskyella maritima]